jgi:hypothetical protein
MPDPARHTAAEIRYELRIVSGPHTINFMSEEIRLASSDEDIAVLMRTTYVGSGILDEKVVAVVGDQWRSQTTEFIHLRNFLKNGGVIGINKDLL